MKTPYTITAAVIAAAVALAGCSGAASSAPATQTNPASQPATRLLWSHIGTFIGEPQVRYVVRVTNPSDNPTSVGVNVRVLDASGTIIGSDQPALPTIPARGHFDYFGTIGGRITMLKGTPTKIEVERAGTAVTNGAPLLKVSDVKLTRGQEDTSTDAPFSYNLSARVTNDTGSVVSGGVTQQFILYDATGNIVGGGTGFSDDVPNSLPAGMSYREGVTGISAEHKATSARYSVWP